MSEPCDVEAIAAVLEDETARAILTELHMEPLTAAELSDRCGASEPTVYRRLADLRECDLLAERTRPDPEGGHHRTVYSATLERVTVEFRDGSLSLRVDRREDMADRFTRLVEGM